MENINGEQQNVDMHILQQLQSAGGARVCKWWEDMLDVPLIQTEK